MKFGNIGLRAKIMSGSIFPMLIIMFLAVTGVLTLRFLTSTLQSTDRISSMNSLAMAIERSVLEMENGILGYLLTGEEPQLERYENAGKKVSAKLAELSQLVSGRPQEAISLESAQKAIEIWQKDYALPALKRRKDLTDSKAIVELYKAASAGEAKKRIDGFKTAIELFRRDAGVSAAEHLKRGDYYATLMERLVIYGVIIAILLTLGISYWLASRIVTPLLEAVNLAAGISTGDLSRRLNVEGRDEIGRLGASLDTMVENLRNQNRQVLDAVDILSTSAAEISTTVSEVAQSTSTTSTSVTETTTTVEEVKQAASLASRKSKEVAQMAQESVRVSSDGRQATEETIARMNLIKEQMESVGETVVRLSEHSQAIEAIIATVQDLADQSNLLAVNASIEAARAGDQGKGFAVVAHEIKSLADQSREATEQVRSILEDTRKWVSAVVMATEQGTKAVDKGVEQSMKAGEAIATLSGSVAESAQAASVIQTSSEQQFTGVEQVAGAMAGIEKAVQANLAGTQQLHGAAQRLADLGNQLKQLVAQYRT